MHSLFILTLFLLPRLFMAATTQLKDTKSSVTFEASTRPAGVKVKGTLDNNKNKEAVTGQYEIEGQTFTGKFDVRLKELDTGIEMRDSHMHEKYLESAKYPLATLEIPKTPFKAEDETAFTGKFTLHGQTNPLSGTFKVKEKNLVLNFKVKLNDYKIELPSFMGITLKEEVNVTAESL